MLAPENRPFLAPPGDEVALAKAIETLAFDAALRDRVGKANQARARAQFNEKAMVEAYRQVYARALRRAAFP
jgi:glycosyltransferase involved in cell wall biosynthesis